MPFPILLVDDNPDDTLLAEMVFRKCKIVNTVLVFKNGSGCLQYLQKQSERILVFLDVKMNPMNGVEVLRSIKKENLATDSIFIMLSGLTNVKQINEAYQIGAKTYFIKPLRVEDVMDLIGNTLRNEVAVQTSEEGNSLLWKR